MSEELEVLKKVQQALQLSEESFEIENILDNFINHDQDSKNALYSLGDFIDRKYLEIDTDEDNPNGKETFYSYWLELNDFRISVRNLVCVSCGSRWDEGVSREVFYIVINENVNSKNAPVDIYIDFSSKEERDSEIKSIRRKLAVFANIRFL